MNDFNTAADQQVSDQQVSEKPSFADTLLAAAIKYRNLLIGGVVLCMIIAGGTWFWIQKTQADEQKASLALSRVIPYMQTGDLEKAISGATGSEGLKAIAEHYGSTPSGNMAKLYLGAIYLSTNKPDAARVMYESFSHKNKDLMAAALAGSASCLTEKKQFAEAADGYEKASSSASNEALRSAYLVRAAETRLAAGQPDKAKKMYDDIIKQFPGSPSAGFAQRAQLRLSGSEQP